MNKAHPSNFNYGVFFNLVVHAAEFQVNKPLTYHIDILYIYIFRSIHNCFFCLMFFVLYAIICI